MRINLIQASVLNPDPAQDLVELVGTHSRMEQGAKLGGVVQRWGVRVNSIPGTERARPSDSHLVPGA